jgi:hypothetical protein
MISTQSLEAQRQSLLSRMEANREQYRRMLMDNPDGPVYGSPNRRLHASGDSHPVEGQYSSDQYGGSHYSRGDRYAHSAYEHGPSPAIQALRWVQEHPLLCAAAVAAVVAIGPSRIVKTAVSGGTALTALTLRNQQNINSIVRVISQVAGYLQNERARRYRP